MFEQVHTRKGPKPAPRDQELTQGETTEAPEQEAGSDVDEAFRKAIETDYGPECKQGCNNRPCPHYRER